MVFKILGELWNLLRMFFLPTQSAADKAQLYPKASSGTLWTPLTFSDISISAPKWRDLSDATHTWEIIKAATALSLSDSAEEKTKCAVI